MLWGLLRATHFAPTLAVTAFTTLLAAVAGRSAGWVAGAVFAGQASVGWGNDWLDRERDRITGRGDKPIVAGVVPADLVGRLAPAALAAALVLSLPLGPAAAAVHAVALLFGWSYNLGLKATPLSVLPYAGAFALLPVFVAVAGPDGAWPPLWTVAAAALLGSGAHFANALPDLDDDARTNVRGLPHRLGATGSALAAAALLGAGALVVAAGPPEPPGPTGLAALGLTGGLVAAVAAAPLAGRPRLAFPLSLAAAGGVVAAFALAAANPPA